MHPNKKRMGLQKYFTYFEVSALNGQKIKLKLDQKVSFTQKGCSMPLLMKSWNCTISLFTYTFHRPIDQC